MQLVLWNFDQLGPEDTSYGLCGSFLHKWIEGCFNYYIFSCFIGEIVWKAGHDPVSKISTCFALANFDKVAGFSRANFASALLRKF